ncbi:protein gvpF [Halobacteriales archaeon QS_8_65_32]|jgi:hypothetical protein|nr:MAG: protein gvpF [Halobacteriales archaeon QS_8_65_32]
MANDHLYTYGVIEQTDVELDIDGVDRAERLYTVDYRTLSAVVSDIDTLEPDETDENIRAHDEVLQTVMERGDVSAVVPMRFGMVFKSVRPLKNVLRSSRSVLSKTLRDIDGTIELGLKLVAEEDVTLDREAIREDVSDRLDGVSLEESENGLFSDRLVLNCSYLVSRDDREDFDAAIAEIESTYGDSLIVQYTGPWAPYNFVDIEIGVDR